MLVEKMFGLLLFAAAETYFALFAHAEKIVSRLLVTPVMGKFKVMDVKWRH